MKRIITIIAAAVLALAALSGCESGGNTTSSETAATSDSVQTMTGDGTVSPDGYSKDFDGFVKYMTDGGFVGGDSVDLTAKEIGAETGKRFTVSSGVSRHTVELYEFKNQTSSMAQKTINNARTDGSFHLFESTETLTKNTVAAVSEDGRFLMLYTDASESDEKSEQLQDAVEAVKKFSK